MIKAIWSTSRDGVMGYQNDLVVKSSEDLKFFKTMTLRSALFMGYSTAVSLPVLPLPNRRCYVHDTTLSETEVVEWNEDVWRVGSLSAVPEENLWIIGGSATIQRYSEYIECAYVTVFNVDVADECSEKDQITMAPRVPSHLSYQCTIHLDDELIEGVRVYSS